jgi:DNA-directed RNA polymerase specialized sigma54-like protein
MKYKKWYNTEREFIKTESQNASDKEIARILSEKTGQSITRSMVRQQRRNIGSVKSNGRPKGKESG